MQCCAVVAGKKEEMPIKESKVFVCKGMNVSKVTPLRRILFVFRQKEWYDKNAIALWWKKSIGTGIIGKPNHRFKFFMIGVSLFNLRLWVDFKWIGKCKNEQRLKLKD
jgi:hypothetical protein